MKTLFWIDPFRDVIKAKDSSFLLMKEALERQKEVFFFEDEDIFLKEGQVYVQAASFSSAFENLELFNKYTMALSDFDCCLLRKEPPVNEAYRLTLKLLAQESPSVFMVNHPNGLLNVHEKIWVSQFSQWTPLTCISSSREELFDFIEGLEQVVIKPIDGFGGQGICIFDSKDSNIRPVVETMTHFYQRPIIVQEYISQVTQGDKRVSVWRDQILGVVLRKSQGQDHCQNICLGGEVSLSTISDKEREMIHTIMPVLKSQGIVWAGFDFIGEKLTEINVTSLACVKLLNLLGDQTVASRLWDLIDKEVML